jgi:phage tail-like protein
MTKSVGPSVLETPLLVYNYRVLVGTINMRFAHVEGLAWERKSVQYRDGLSFLDGEMLALWRVDSYSTITLQQGVLPADSKLHDWLRQGDSRMIQVQLCAADGATVLVWQANRAVPIKLTGSALDAKGGDVFIDSLEVKAAGWSIKHPV